MNADTLKAVLNRDVPLKRGWFFEVEDVFPDWIKVTLKKRHYGLFVENKGSLSHKNEDELINGFITIVKHRAYLKGALA